MARTFVTCAYCKANVREEECVEVESKSSGNHFYLCDKCYKKNNKWLKENWKVYMYS
ncbi:hypothetical protein KAR91_02080 [Candidatus Pacearchaeota archaeon]|nr:hypothetical protein [Candidatus Pacearchaeota archaeon]